MRAEVLQADRGCVSVIRLIDWQPRSRGPLTRCASWSRTGPSSPSLSAARAHSDNAMQQLLYAEPAAQLGVRSKSDVAAPAAALAHVIPTPLLPRHLFHAGDKGDSDMSRRLCFPHAPRRTSLPTTSSTFYFILRPLPPSNTTYHGRSATSAHCGRKLTNSQSKSLRPAPGARLQPVRRPVRPEPLH